MNCRQCKDAIGDYLSGRLDPLTSALVSAHCAKCVACAEELKAEESLRTRFMNAPVVTSTPDVWAQLASQLPSRKQRVWNPRLWFYGSSVAFTTAVLALFFLLRPPMTKTPIVTPVTPVVSAPPAQSKVIAELRGVGVSETEYLFQETSTAVQVGLAPQHIGLPAEEESGQ